MQRYIGQPLPPDARIALMSNDALGNYAVATLLAQGFRFVAPRCTLDYYGGERTKEFEIASVRNLFSWRESLLGRTFSSAVSVAEARSRELGGYDIVLNIEQGLACKALSATICDAGTLVCGPCLSPDSRADWDYPDDERGDLWRDKAWTAGDLPVRYSFLNTGFIGEIFYKLAYLPPYRDGEWGDIPSYSFPDEEPALDFPDIVISTGASLPQKLWQPEKWKQLIGQLNQPVGLLGAAPSRQKEFYHSASDEKQLVSEGAVVDLRGKLSLPQVAYVLKKAKLVITIDNGILHIAAAFSTPTVGLYRKEIVRLWAPPNPRLKPIAAETDRVADIPLEKVLSVAQEVL